MNGAGVEKAVCVLEAHGAGYRLWADDPFIRLVFAIPGVTRLKRSTVANTCWDVTIDPRFDRDGILGALCELKRQAEVSPGIGRWAQ